MTKEATPKKVAFMTKPYSNEQRIEKEEKELKELVEEQKGEAKEEEPSSPEEKTFKKRYSDLRRHQQKQSEEFKTKIEALESQLSEATRKEMKLPTSEEDLDAWVKKYPDIAAIVETIAIKKAKEQSADIQKKLQAIDEMKISATKEKAEAELLRAKLFNNTAEFFNKYDLLVCPTVMVPPFDVEIRSETPISNNFSTISSEGTL